MGYWALGSGHDLPLVLIRLRYFWSIIIIDISPPHPQHCTSNQRRLGGSRTEQTPSNPRPGEIDIYVQTWFPLISISNTPAALTLRVFLHDGRWRAPRPPGSQLTAHIGGMMPRRQPTPVDAAQRDHGRIQQARGIEFVS